MTPNYGSEETHFFKKEKDGLLGGNDGDTGLMKGGRWYRYFQTKLATSVSMRCLHDKLVAASERNEECKNVLSLRAHPGVARTSFWDDIHEGGFFCAQNYPIVHAIFCRWFYWITKRNDGLEVMGGNAIPNRPLAYVSLQKQYERLWRTSEEATGVDFVLLD